MPVKRRASKKKKTLSDLDYEFYLGYLLNGSFGFHQEPVDKETAFEIWASEKTRLLDYYRQDPFNYSNLDEQWLHHFHYCPLGGMTRPYGWFLFEAPEPLSIKTVLHDCIHVAESHYEHLDRHNLFDAHDKAYMKRFPDLTGEDWIFLQERDLHHPIGIERWCKSYRMYTATGKAEAKPELELLLKLGFITEPPTFKSVS